MKADNHYETFYITKLYSGEFVSFNFALYRKRIREYLKANK